MLEIPPDSAYLEQCQIPAWAGPIEQQYVRACMQQGQSAFTRTGQTCGESMTWGFSRLILKGSCSSWAKESSGDRVPLVSSTLRTCMAASWRMLTPGEKHQYDSVGWAIPVCTCTISTSHRVTAGKVYLQAVPSNHPDPDAACCYSDRSSSGSSHDDLAHGMHAGTKFQCDVQALVFCICIKHCDKAAAQQQLAFDFSRWTCTL